MYYFLKYKYKNNNPNIKSIIPYSIRNIYVSLSSSQNDFILSKFLIIDTE